MNLLRTLVTRNWTIKLFSLALATILWVTISRQANSEIGIRIPLEYRNIPPQLEVMGDATNSVEIRLRGAAALIREISAADISATLDLGNIAPGEKIIQLTPANVQSPVGVDVVRVSPSQVKLSLERTTSKSIPVRVLFDGSPDAGVDVQDSVITPAVVVVQGPESRIRRLQSLPTATIHLAGRKVSFTETVDIDLPDPMLRLQSVSSVEVRVRLRESKERGPQ